MRSEIILRIEHHCLQHMPIFPVQLNPDLLPYSLTKLLKSQTGCKMLSPDRSKRHSSMYFHKMNMISDGYLTMQQLSLEEPEASSEMPSSCSSQSQKPLQ